MTLERAAVDIDLVPWVLGAGVAAVVLSRLSRWQPPAAADEYRAIFASAARDSGVPELLLLRVAQQESAFRPAVIDGRVKSSAGAVGIMQIVPRWHPGVDPLDVRAAVNYAARYLASLHQKFGSWPRALAAYNWGQGNLSEYIAGRINIVPLETRRYVSQIISDVFPSAELTL